MIGNTGLKELVYRNDLKYITAKWLHEMIFPESLQYKPEAIILEMPLKNVEEYLLKILSLNQLMNDDQLV